MEPGRIGTGRAWPPVVLRPPTPRPPGVAAGVASDLTYLRGMERLTGAETLAAVAIELAHALDRALTAGDGLTVARYTKELRATMAALGRPEDTTSDAAFLDRLSTAVGHPPQP